MLNGADVVAEHARTFDRGQQVEEPSHIQSLVEYKRQAHLHRSQDRLLHAVPQASELLVRLGQAGGNLGSAVAAFTRLLDSYGATELQAAVAQVLLSPAPHPGSVRQILESRRHQRGLAPPVALVLPAHVRAITVRPHALSNYDALTKKETPDE